MAVVALWDQQAGAAPPPHSGSAPAVSSGDPSRAPSSLTSRSQDNWFNDTEEVFAVGGTPAWPSAA